MFINKILIFLGLLSLILCIQCPPLGATVIGSKHDLSNGAFNQVCIYCHTPHHANITVSPPLWNRNIGDVTFQVYGSPTMNTINDNPPTGVSQLCLSCHDNVNAAGNKHSIVYNHGGGAYPGKCTACHFNKLASIGTDLRNDHPISMDYPDLTEDPAFNTPPDPLSGWGGSSHNDVKLYSGRVECPSCHNAHDPTVIPFLRKPNNQSALCITCHIK